MRRNEGRREPAAVSASADERSRRRALARRKLAAVRRRARRIRAGVIALAIAIFLLAFAGIYTQLATGHDPALSKSTRKTATSTSQGSQPSASESQSSSASTTEAQGSESGEAESQSSPSTVRTSQS